MRWDELFDRAGGADASVAAVTAALRERREEVGRREGADD